MVSDKSNPPPKHRTLRSFFRTGIVFVTWFIVALRPYDLRGFYETLAIASLTSVYEYAVLYLDSEDGPRATLGIVGTIFSIVYLLSAIAGAFGIITLNLHNLKMGFANQVRIPFINNLKWDYALFIIPMIVFPFTIIIEAYLAKLFVANATTSDGGA